MTQSQPSAHAPRIGVVFGGGALKGLAHIGALRAIEEAGVVPAVYAGSSIGAMIAAAAAAGTSPDELTERAVAVRRRDLFRINHFGMLMQRMLSRSIYLESPLRELCDTHVPEGNFDELPTPLLVTALDIERATPVVFGRPGLRNVRVRDAVYASCALPGFFPPGTVAGRTCIDGGTTDNLPVDIAAIGVDAIIAVDVGIADVPIESGVAAQGFASIFLRAATIMMHEQQQYTLERWTTPPLLLVRPNVSHIGWFSFSHAEELMRLGYDATREALRHLPQLLNAEGGVHPRRSVTVTVDRRACTGCAQCVARAPAFMTLDVDGTAIPRASTQEFSPADGAFVRCCPVDAIHVAPVAICPAPSDIADSLVGTGVLA